MDILRLLDDLHAVAVERPRHIPLTPFVYGLDKDEISMQIAKVRASLPQELKTAASTVRESERILDVARQDAAATIDGARKESERILAETQKEVDRMMEQARLQQERMLAESEILKLSKAQSEEIRNAAERESTQMRRGAEKYAYDVLSQLEGVVGKVMTTIERGKQEMQRPELPPQAGPSREKALGR